MSDDEGYVKKREDPEEGFFVNSQGTKRQPPQVKTVNIGPSIDNIVQAAVRAMMLHDSAREANSTRRAQKAPLKNSEIAALLPEFSGVDDDADAWIERVNAVQIVHQIADDIMHLAAVSKFTGQAKEWFHSKTDYVIMPWDTFLVEFRNMFSSRPSKVQLMKKFEARRWRKTEKFSSYYSDKVTLGNRAGVQESDLVEYMIDGFDNAVLQSQARMQQFMSLSDLLQAMKSITNEDRASTSHRNDSGRQPYVPRVNRPTDTRSYGSSGARGMQPIQRCYNCNDVGHIASHCSKPRRETGSCYVCASRDHLIRDCPNRNRNRRTDGPVPAAADSTTHLVTEQPSPPPLSPALMQPISLQLNPLDKYQILLNAIVDSGSPVSLIRSDIVTPNLYDNAGGNNNNLFRNLQGVNGSPIAIEGLFTREIKIADITLTVTFAVVPVSTISHVCLLGRDILCSGKLEMNIGPKVTIKPLQNSTDDVHLNEILHIDTFDFQSERASCPVTLNVNESIPDEVRLKLESEFVAHYVKPERPLQPEVRIQLKIVTSSEETPFSSRPRRLSYADKQAVGHIIDDLLERKIIRKSSSEYSSPIVLVKRKDKLRLCVDYRVLNAITKRDNYPLPLIEDHLDSLRDKSYFTRLDLKDAFHHVYIEPESIKFTSFVTPVGQFEYVKMPFGLKNAPSCFMRFVSSAFRDLIDRGNVLIYMDDILIATTSIEENLEILKQVYKVLVANKLELRLDKCQFLNARIVYLGYEIDKDGIRPSEENVRAVTEFPIPVGVKTLHSFIGLASFFRRFIPDFSVTMSPLYDLLKLCKGNPDQFEFNELHLRAFETIKAILISKPLLRIYSPTAETQLHCDASAKGFASILMQKQADGCFHPIFYFSKRTSEAESKFHSFELEALAIVYSLKRFEIYLKGMRFTIVTDCNSLKMTLEKRDINPRILRWTLVLSQFDYALEHRKAERMQHVDALSRSILVIEENSFEKNLALMQTRDPTIRSLRETLEKTELPNYEMRDGLVYRKTQGKLLFYVPNRMIHHVVRSCHDNVGHVGLQKTLDLITNHYWFPKMQLIVKEYIENCLKCIIYQPKSGKKEGLLHPIPKGDVPFVTLHLDHYGPLEKTGRQYKYVFAVVDSFSKLVKLYPCKTTNAGETIKHLRTYFQNFSRPKRVIADRGSNFRSIEFSNFLDENNIKLVLVAKSTPRANGQVERTNRDLTPMIAKLASAPNKWDTVLGEVEFAINNTVHRSTGQCPSILVFGLRQRGAVVDLLKEYLEADVPIARELDVLRTSASGKIERDQEKTKIAYDKSHKPARVYSVGDYVVCTNIDVTPGVNKKHLPKFRGPYEVKKVLLNDRYLVEDIEGFQVTQIPYQGTLAASDMKPWVSP